MTKACRRSCRKRRWQKYTYMVMCCTSEGALIDRLVFSLLRSAHSSWISQRSSVIRLAEDTMKGIYDTILPPLCSPVLVMDDQWEAKGGGGGTCIHPTGQTNSPSLLWYLVVISTLWDQLLGYGNCYRVQSTVSIRETPGYSFSINRSMKKVFFFSFVLLIAWGPVMEQTKKGRYYFLI
jgi:hypothetical protein